MALVNSEIMLLDAQKNGYAVGAFNVENMEMVKGVILAAEELNAPVILQTTPSTINYGGVEIYPAIIRAEAMKAKIPVCIHLDHGNSYELAEDCVNNGYTSVMIDGSNLSFEKNIELTKKVVRLATKKGIPVEAELGKVGGKEDALECEGDKSTDPIEAKMFVDRTGVKSLAIAIGTAHGFYSGTPKLEKERLSEIRESVNIPLVLHGASGLSNDDIRDCIKRGICKVNFATELRAAYTGAIRKVLLDNPHIYDPKELGAKGIAAINVLVKERIIVCGCNGKA